LTNTIAGQKETPLYPLSPRETIGWLTMPLYTYVVSYRGATYVSQARRSNFQGSGDWATELPKDALPPALRKEVLSKMYGGFEAIPNCIHAWKKRFTVDGTEFVVIAVQTES
jgi:hypothetical protein